MKITLEPDIESQEEIERWEKRRWVFERVMQFGMAGVAQQPYLRVTGENGQEESAAWYPCEFHHTHRGNDMTRLAVQLGVLARKVEAIASGTTHGHSSPVPGDRGQPER